VACGNGNDTVTVVVTLPPASQPTPTAASGAAVTAAGDITTEEADLDTPGPGVCLDAQEREFLEMINSYRLENGLGALVDVAALNLAAYRHSVDMGTRGYFDHVTPGGVEPWDRARRAGYDGFTRVSENIFGATNGDTAASAFNSWKASEEHNAAMLDPAVTMIGIGYATLEDSRFTHYWTTLFSDQPGGAPPQSCPATES
jgi:uncharacterized protein YkwD